MSKTSYAISLMFEATQSGKLFRGRKKSSLEYSPLIGPPSSDNKGAVHATPQSVVQLIRQGFPLTHHPSTPPPPPPPLYTPFPTPPPPPPPFNMSNTMKLQIFKGIGRKDTDQFWFVVNVVWTMQQITNDNIKKVQLVTTLQDRVLAWYIKYCSDNPLATLAETKTALKKDFSKSKSDSQSLVGFKEIMMRVMRCLRSQIKG